MKSFRTLPVLFVLIFANVALFGQQNHAKVYWVGHSLVSAVDPYESNSTDVMRLLGQLAEAAGKTYNYHKHTIPGAPLGWNWGGPEDAWNGGVESLIQPLLNPVHNEYGSFTAIVLTEGVNLHATIESWKSEFYARNFYAAAKKANPETRLFLYESWHHFNASDREYERFYGPVESFNWRQYMLDVRAFWNLIADRAGDLNVPYNPNEIKPDYLNFNFTTERTAPNDPYRGPGDDPTQTDEDFEVFIVPTGQVLVKVLDRIEENRSDDDWAYAGAANNGQLSALDFFANPYRDANDPSSVVHTADDAPGHWAAGQPDDIHPSHVLIYLNALTHFAVIYQENPAELPALNGVPNNIAKIFKEVVWEVVTTDEKTGLNSSNELSNEGFSKASFKAYPNPLNDHISIYSEEDGIAILYNGQGQIVGELAIAKGTTTHHLGQLKSGIYFLEQKGRNEITRIKMVRP